MKVVLLIIEAYLIYINLIFINIFKVYFENSYFKYYLRLKKWAALTQKKKKMI